MSYDKESMNDLAMRLYFCENEDEKYQLENELAIVSQPFCEYMVAQYRLIKDRQIIESAINYALVRAIKNYDPQWLSTDDDRPKKERDILHLTRNEAKELLSQGKIEVKSTFTSYLFLYVKYVVVRETYQSAHPMNIKPRDQQIAYAGKAFITNFEQENKRMPTIEEISAELNVPANVCQVLFSNPIVQYSGMTNEAGEEMEDPLSLLVSDEADILEDIATKITSQDTLKTYLGYVNDYYLASNQFRSIKDKNYLELGFTLKTVAKVVEMKNAFSSMRAFKAFCKEFSVVDDGFLYIAKQIYEFLTTSNIELPLSEEGKRQLNGFIEKNNKAIYVKLPTKPGRNYNCKQALIFSIYINFYTTFYGNEGMVDVKNAFTYSDIGELFDLSRERVRMLCKKITNKVAREFELIKTPSQRDAQKRAMLKFLYKERYKVIK